MNACELAWAVEHPSAKQRSRSLLGAHAKFFAVNISLLLLLLLLLLPLFWR